MSELQLQTGLTSELKLPGQTAFLDWDYQSMDAHRLDKLAKIRFIEKAFVSKDKSFSAKKEKGI